MDHQDFSYLDRLDITLIPVEHPMNRDQANQAYGLTLHGLRSDDGTPVDEGAIIRELAALWAGDKTHASTHVLEVRKGVTSWGAFASSAAILVMYAAKGAASGAGAVTAREVLGRVATRLSAAGDPPRLLTLDEAVRAAKNRITRVCEHIAAGDLTVTAEAEIREPRGWRINLHHPAGDSFSVEVHPSGSGVTTAYSRTNDATPLA